MAHAPAGTSAAAAATAACQSRRRDFAIATAAPQLLFLAAVTPIMHNFWDVKDPQSPAALVDQINFFKNLALAGALLSWLSMKRDIARLSMNDKLKAA